MIEFLLPCGLSAKVLTRDILAPHRMNNLDQVNKLLDGSYHSMPQPMDTEKYAYFLLLMISFKIDEA